MMRGEWLAEKRREVDRLGDVATNAIVPSGRDFTQFLAGRRSELAVVPRLKRCDPVTAGQWPDLDLVGAARIFDDSAAAAIALCTAAVHGGLDGDLVAVRSAVSAPLLRDDLCLDLAQVYDSRLHGADAVRIPVGDLASAEIDRLADTALSLHMTPVLEVVTGADLERAPLQAGYCVGLNPTGGGGFADVAVVRELARFLPSNIVVIVLAEVSDLAAAMELRGEVDAVVVGDLLLDSPQPERDVERLVAP